MATVVAGESSLRRTSLYEAHRAAGARMVPFAGWEMPAQYLGVTEEHLAVRSRVGVFDVSHMGEVRVEGPGALAAVQRLITNDAGRLAVGQGLYTPMCTPSGGIVDDVTVFRVADQVYLVVVNAARRAADLAWIQAHVREIPGATVHDVSDEIALLALQGPGAAALLERLSLGVASLRRFHLRDGVGIAGVRTTVMRTGYTGEDGFEIAVAWDAAPTVWAVLVEAGGADGLQPAGLGARDTLRLEAAFMLYGNDIDEATTPLEAPLGWTVKFDKGDFNGKDALLRQRTQGVARRLVGFEGEERAIPRQHCGIYAAGERVGEVTSGTFAPFLRRPIALGYVPMPFSDVGTAVGIDVRGRSTRAHVVRLPFYRRPMR
ncbi:MAG: glycine cleavage system aminomethyltransferase GcvT [Armatimonadetes bacterium]|nr:glycine cleavage system aminomethyltransferase GcvT [Armatimonadota bacterium]